MTRKVLGYRWQLRQVMAQHGLFSTTELMPLLAERDVNLSPAQVYRLVVQSPERLNLNTLVALCDIFGCTPSDLIEPTVEPARKAATKRSAGTSGAGAAKALRPRRARISPS